MLRTLLYATARACPSPASVLYREQRRQARLWWRGGCAPPPVDLLAARDTSPEPAERALLPALLASKYQNRSAGAQSKFFT